MLEESGDLFELGERDVTVITTNGYVARSGKAVMGRGVALKARDTYPGIDTQLGHLLTEHGNHIHQLWATLIKSPTSHNGISVLKPPRLFVSLPVKQNYWEKADMELIKRSLGELIIMAYQMNWQRVVMPRVGTGAGLLPWDEVKPLLTQLLDDRFVVVSYGA